MIRTFSCILILILSQPLFGQRTNEHCVLTADSIMVMKRGLAPPPVGALIFKPYLSQGACSPFHGMLGFGLTKNSCYSLSEQPAFNDDKETSSPELPLVFSDDFENGHEHWDLTDAKAWSLSKVGDNHVFGLNKRISEYQPKFRSPHNIALIKNLELTDFVITFKVKSTKDTGNHRDCCVFFCHQDPSNFYYCHLGARPDPNSGQIMIVKNAPRIALTNNQKATPWNDDWHRVKLERNFQAGTIKVYFDDMNTPHMTVNNKTFGKGRIGIGSFDDMNDFDEIRVYGR